MLCSGGGDQRGGDSVVELIDFALDAAQHGNLEKHDQFDVISFVWLVNVLTCVKSGETAGVGHFGKC